jgi:hypothetical protein
VRKIQSPIQMVPGTLLQRAKRQGVQLSAHFCLVPRSILCVSIPPFTHIF